MTFLPLLEKGNPFLSSFFFEQGMTKKEEGKRRLPPPILAPLPPGWQQYKLAFIGHTLLLLLLLLHSPSPQGRSTKSTQRVQLNLTQFLLSNLNFQISKMGKKCVFSLSNPVSYFWPPEKEEEDECLCLSSYLVQHEKEGKGV